MSTHMTNATMRTLHVQTERKKKVLISSKHLTILIGLEMKSEIQISYTCIIAGRRLKQVSFLSFRVTGDRADLSMDGAESSWVASAVIGSLGSVLIVTIIVLLIIFRRRIMAKIFQPTEPVHKFRGSFAFIRKCGASYVIL